MKNKPRPQDEIPSVQALRAQLTDARQRAIEIQSAVVDELSAAGEAAVERAERAERALRIREAVVEASVAGLAVWDLEGNITYVNPAFLAMWGYNRAEDIEGRNFRDLLADESKAAAIASTVEQLGGWIGKLAFIGRDGSPFTVMLSASPLQDADGTRSSVVGSFVEMTYRERLSDMLFRQARWLRVSHEIDQGILSGAELEGIARTTLNAVLELTSCVACSITLLKPEELESRLLARSPERDAAGRPPEVGVSLIDFEEALEALRQEGICWFQAAEHPSLPPAALGFADMADGDKLVAASLVFEEELLGSLNLRLKPDTRLTSSDEKLLRQIADSLAVAVRYAQLATRLEDIEHERTRST